LELDQETMDVLVHRVAAELSKQLEAMIADLVTPKAEPAHLTVADVAERLGIARSTVYAHWREWGGFKLGDAQKAPIRFPLDGLLTGAGASPRAAKQARQDPPLPQRRRRRRTNVIGDAPRLPIPSDFA
jgi:transposase-like protein